MSLPPEATLDEVKVRIRQSYTNRNVGKISQVVLKDGPRAFKIATLTEIINPETKEFHHYSLKIDHIDKKVRDGWFAKPERSTRIEGGEPDEIGRLFMFLQANLQGQLTHPGDLHVIRSSDYAKLEAILHSLPNLATSDKTQLVGKLLEDVEDSENLTSDLLAAFKHNNPETLRHIAVASRWIEYQVAFEELQRLVADTSTLECQFQRHLADNPWMFGSEYSELMSRHNWTRDDKLDYMLRRSVDGYLEIIEIKTAFTDKLFRHDASHNSYYPSSKLTPVLGQVVRYIEEVERNRDTIIAQDGVDTLKIRARVIAGRDGDAEQVAALRNLNAHLHRIEVITYDQLLKIASRVLGVFASDETICEGEQEEVDLEF